MVRNGNISSNTIHNNIIIYLYIRHKERYVCIASVLIHCAEGARQPPLAEQREVRLAARGKWSIIVIIMIVCFIHVLLVLSLTL